MTGDLTGRTIGHYRVTASLGAGGMGEVYRATDTKLQREVAIKVLPAAFAEDNERLLRFEREARLLARLHHPNIASIFGLEESDGVRALVMELVEGPTLAERLEAGSLPLAEGVAIARQIAEALDEAHEKGVVHRDLKPQNIKLTRSGQVKVLDFGLAKQFAAATGSLADATTQITKTTTGLVLGTVGYMAPEQVRGEKVDRRADIFALGCVLYELLTGERAFRRTTAIETLSAILNDEPSPASQRRRDLPPSVDRLLARCFEKDPARRFASCRELATELAAIGVGSANERADDPSLAVLPFADMSAEHDQEYFCEGLAEELITGLSRIRGLRVASRTSSFQFKGRDADAREIGQRLGVRAILAGSVRKAGTRLRITVELIDATSGYRLWAERYDRQLEDIFEIQDEASRRVIEALQVRLAIVDASTHTRAAAPNAHAYDLYLRGRSFFYRATRRDFELAQQLFRQAIEIDPTYVRPRAGLADCFSLIYREFERRPALLEDARAEATRALEIEPGSAQAHASLGFALSLAGDRAAAEAAFQAAMRLDPELFEPCYLYASEILYGWGDFELAATLFVRASEVAPDDFQSLIILAGVYHGLGRKVDLEHAARRGLTLAQARLEVNPRDLRALYLGAQALALVGDRDGAIEWAGRALELDGRATSIVLFNVSCVEAILGRVEEAMDLLEAAVAKGWGRTKALRIDPLLTRLQGEPRFRALLQRMELEQAAEEAR